MKAGAITFIGIRNSTLFRLTLQPAWLGLQKIMQKILSLFFVLLLLVSCVSPLQPPIKQAPVVAPQVNLDVLTIAVLDRTTQGDIASPYATNDFQPTIANAIRRMVNEKFVAVGSTGEAIFVIRDASLKSEAIPHNDSWFTREQTSKYAAHVNVELDVTRQTDHGQVTVEASQFSTLPENSTKQERQDAYGKVLKAITDEVGDNLRRGIKDHISGFVATKSPAK